jgi:phage terminase large subunit GpA-like protein
MIASDIAFWFATADTLHDYQAPRLISSYVDGHRSMPKGISRFPGLWDTRRSEYSREIMDDMSPFSGIQVSVTMKGRKLGITAAAENVVGYWMSANPASLEYITATDDLAKDWSIKRLEPLIDSLGFRHKLTHETTNKKTRRTGDTVFQKQVIGGFLDIISAGSSMARRAGDIRVLVIDEIDGRDATLTTGEGYWLDILEAHTSSWGTLKKIMEFSSPTTTENSEIYRKYLMGDQRKFIIPCPACNMGIELIHDEKSKGGITGILKDGIFDHAIYVCQECGAELVEADKERMIPFGHWEPTEKPIHPAVRSRQISTLYSPYGMYSWTEYWRDWLTAKDDPESERTFTNIRKGLPYEETGNQPTLETVTSRIGSYHEGEIPSGIIWLSAGIDVQQGKRAWQTLDEGPRLEMEILGHGEGYSTWSICYKKFYGPVRDPYAGAWEKLTEWWDHADERLPQKGDGMCNFGSNFPVRFVFVDSGDGELMDVVYRFCGRYPQVFQPCKGTGWVTPDKLKAKGDVAGPMNFKHFNVSQALPGQALYLISTNYYKNELYNRLAIPRNPDAATTPGYCDFPAEYSNRPEYFQQLRAASRHADGSFHSKGRDEALDCRVYAMCAGEAYAMWFYDSVIKQKRKEGATEQMVREYTLSRFLHDWAANIRSK